MTFALLLHENTSQLPSSIFRRSHIERDGDRVGRAAREEGGQAARRRGASHTQP